MPGSVAPLTSCLHIIQSTKIPDDVTQCPFPEEKNERIKKEQGNYRWFLPDAPDVTDDQGMNEFLIDLFFVILSFVFLFRSCNQIL